MHEFTISTVAFHSTVVSFLILLTKYYVTIFIQGYKRVLAGSRPPEDTKLFAKAGEQSFNGLAKFAGKNTNDRYVKALKEGELRWLRIVSNDVENVPLGLIVGVFSLVCGYSNTLHVVSIGCFTVCRVMHTVSYAYEWQPHRVITFTGAVGGTFGMLGNVALGAWWNQT